MKGMKVLSLALVAAFCLVGMGSCSSGGPATGDLLVANDPFSGDAITFISALSGPEPLDAAVFLVPGDSFTFFGVLAGVYDIEVTWSDTSTSAFFGVFVPAGGLGTVDAFHP